MQQFIYIERDDLSNPGYDMGIEVYLLKFNDFPELIDSNYNLSHASTHGYQGEAVQLVGKKLGHKHDNYKFLSKNIKICGL